INTVIEIVLQQSVYRSQKDNVMQPQGDVTAAEGEAVTLGCQYNSTTFSDEFYWYRQYPGKPAEFLIFHVGIQNASNHRLFVEAHGEKVQVQISSAAVSDSAVYYCARATSSGRCCMTCALCSTIQSIITAAVQRTVPTLNVEHQPLCPVDFNLVVQMEHWLWILLTALGFGNTTSGHGFRQYWKAEICQNYFTFKCSSSPPFRFNICEQYPTTGS
uniref:Ig-like domain-containing protein n=1 Tax=Sphaeramia orbicularis TaxID=375764 RepID=A0A672YD81_9TELE